MQRYQVHEAADLGGNRPDQTVAGQDQVNHAPVLVEFDPVPFGKRRFGQPVGVVVPEVAVGGFVERRECHGGRERQGEQAGARAEIVQRHGDLRGPGDLGEHPPIAGHARDGRVARCPLQRGVRHDDSCRVEGLGGHADRIADHERIRGGQEGERPGDLLDINGGGPRRGARPRGDGCAAVARRGDQSGGAHRGDIGGTGLPGNGGATERRALLVVDGGGQLCRVGEGLEVQGGRRDGHGGGDRGRGRGRAVAARG